MHFRAEKCLKSFVCQTFPNTFENAANVSQWAGHLVHNDTPFFLGYNVSYSYHRFDKHEWLLTFYLRKLIVFKDHTVCAGRHVMGWKVFQLSFPLHAAASEHSSIT
jgi:hypothetical protein